MPLNEILRLVNLLKEYKLCSVVIILNKDELNKQESSSDEVGNLKNWYETRKEKVIDYEVVIDNNDETARKIIEENLKRDNEEIKHDIIDIILNYFKQKLNNNLRLLIKIAQRINDFNKECFMQFYDYKEREIFIDTFLCPLDLLEIQSLKC